MAFSVLGLGGFGFGVSVWFWNSVLVHGCHHGCSVWTVPCKRKKLPTSCQTFELLCRRIIEAAQNHDIGNCLRPHGRQGHYDNIVFYKL